MANDIFYMKYSADSFNFLSLALLLFQGNIYFIEYCDFLIKQINLTLNIYNMVIIMFVLQYFVLFEKYSEQYVPSHAHQVYFYLWAFPFLLVVCGRLFLQIR